jgi:formiminotetrahydrofolate cyclodeaminase
MDEPEMMTQQVQDYLDRLAGKLPAPGGGSAAALAGALGAASAAMVANFTVGNEKYAEAQEEMERCLAAIEAVRSEMARLVDEDVTAYSAVGAAYGMPRGTDEEKAARTAAIQEALRAAAAVPMRLAAQCAALAEQLPPLLEKGNRNLVSDVGVAARLAEAACECAWLNVEVNLAYLKDEGFIKAARAEAEEYLGKVREICHNVWEGTAAAIVG